MLVCRPDALVAVMCRSIATMNSKRETEMQEPEGHEIGRIYFPSSPSEFITVFAHFHRAEIARMAGWRDRIDRTTNWAITLVAAMLSVSLFDVECSPQRADVRDGAGILSADD